MYPRYMYLTRCYICECMYDGRFSLSLFSFLFPHRLRSCDKAMASANSHEAWYVDPNVLRPAIAAYPTLLAAIFPPPPTSLTPSQSQDVTVYMLLQVG